MDWNAVAGACPVPNHVGERAVAAILRDLAGAFAPLPQLWSMHRAPGSLVGANTFLIQFDQISHDMRPNWEGPVFIQQMGSITPFRWRGSGVCTTQPTPIPTPDHEAVRSAPRWGGFIQINRSNGAGLALTALGCASPVTINGEGQGVEGLIMGLWD
jgi:hypothetical protein